jgi:hypothetical protein
MVNLIAAIQHHRYIKALDRGQFRQSYGLACRGLTRLTNACSKKVENFEAAVALNFAYYNFVKSHGAIRMTPAQAAGIESNAWTVAELVERCGE